MGCNDCKSSLFHKAIWMPFYLRLKFMILGNSKLLILLAVAQGAILVESGNCSWKPIEQDGNVNKLFKGIRKSYTVQIIEG